MPDQLWKTAFDLIEEAERFPLAERRAFIESQTSDPRIREMVAELVLRQERHPEDELPAIQPGDGFYGTLADPLQLGEGSSGQVFSASDPELDRTVALKFLVERTVPSERAGRQPPHPRGKVRFGAQSSNHRYGA